MRQMAQMLTMALSAVACTAVADDYLIEGSLLVTSNLTAQSLFVTNASAETLKVSGTVALSESASIGAGNCTLTNRQALVMGDRLVSHGDGTITARGFFGNGEGLTNVTSSAVAAGAIRPEALAAAAVRSVSIADGAVTSNKLAAGSVGIGKAVLSDWNAWGDRRYLSATGASDLAMNPGRLALGFGLNITNMGNKTCGSLQAGWNLGVQSIGEWSLGASQCGYNSGTQIIGFGVSGASQRGYNLGYQVISNQALGAFQCGYNTGTQMIVGARGSSQLGHNSGWQLIDTAAFGASQQGFNESNGVQKIAATAYGAEQRGYNAGSLLNAGKGASQHAYNLGTMAIASVGAYGSEQRGYVAAGASATNLGRGSIQLLSLTNAQVARITGNASIGLGACTVTHDQSLVAGDGLASRGNGTVTAYGFYGDGRGLTNLSLAPYVGKNLTWDPASKKLNAAAGYSDSNAVAAVLAACPRLADGDDDVRWSGTADRLNPVAARKSLGLGAAATNEVWAFAPADLSRYASDTVAYSNGQFHAAAWLNAKGVSNAVLAAWQKLDTDATDDLTSSGATMAGDFDMNSHRVRNLPAPQADGDAVAKKYLRQVLSCLPPQGNLSMGAFTNGAPGSFPLTF